jgi:hypothetical protein
LQNARNGIKMLATEEEYEYFCTDCHGIISPNDKVCPHCGADTSIFIEEEDSFDALDEEILPKKYPALQIIAVLYQILAVLIAIATLISFIIQLTFNPLFSIISLVVGMIGVITCLAFSEGIKVFIDIEYGIRNITQLLKRPKRDEE